ncbi:MAG: 50S ribosomal protein L4 [bacterium]|nr:50S ribosomal protein L4 [bacterium]
MKATKYDSNGKKSGEAELPGALFGETFSKAAIHAVIRAENANRRQGTHKVKGRSEIRGGGKKPWKQKGTGNARQGSIRAPQWRGGGTVFGPTPRSYRIDLPEKIRKSGIRSIFSSKAKDGAISVIADVQASDYSTKAAYEIFKNMGMESQSVVVVVAGADEKLKKSFANIPNIQLISAERLTAPELYYAAQVVIAEKTLEDLAARYERKSRRTEVA